MQIEKTNPSYEGQFTKEQFTALQNLYDYFNKTLFADELTPCLLNLSRKSKNMGFYSPDRWKKQVGKSDDVIKVLSESGFGLGSKNTIAELTKDGAEIAEISINPDYLYESTKEYCQTLVHEMCHHWQYTFGKPTPGYHNKEWATKMKAVGLQPTHNGLPGGKETGKKMADIAIEGGVFDEAYANIPSEILLPLIAIPNEEKKKKQQKKNKIKYTCPDCGANAWGKPNMSIACGGCSDADAGVLVKFVSAESAESEEESLFNDF